MDEILRTKIAGIVVDDALRTYNVNMAMRDGVITADRILAIPEIADAMLLMRTAQGRIDANDA